MTSSIEDQTTILKALQGLIKKYDFEYCKPFGNEREAYVAVLPCGSVHIGVFDGMDEVPWVSVQVAFGEVRHVWQNRTHLGEHGMASASSSFRTEGEQSGCLLLGAGTLGFCWRHGFCGTKGRTSGGIDGYVQVEDIIEHLMGFSEEALGIQDHPDSFLQGAWDQAERGW